jgi:hypothetical protein
VNDTRASSYFFTFPLFNGRQVFGGSVGGQMGCIKRSAIHRADIKKQIVFCFAFSHTVKVFLMQLFQFPL